MIGVCLVAGVGFANAVVARIGIFSMVAGGSGAGRPRVLSGLRRNIVGGARQPRRRMIGVCRVPGVGFANAVVARIGIFSMVAGGSGAERPRVLSSLRRNIVGGGWQRRRVETVGQISGAVIRCSRWDFHRRLQGGLARQLKRLRLQAMVARIRISKMEVIGHKLRGRRRHVARLPVESRYRQRQINGAVIGCSQWDFRRRVRGGLARQVDRLSRWAMVARILMDHDSAAVSMI